jgi:5-methylcytosine-specific restriction endonuclease McrA
MIFINNKYTVWYNSIIAAALSRTTTGYVEKHHIIPKSLGGSDSVNNLVRLTAKEHYIVHRLLVKMTTGTDRSKMQLAISKMMQCSNNQERYKCSPRSFATIREQAALAMSGKYNPNYGKPRAAATRKKISQAVKAHIAINGTYTHTPESKAKISAANKGNSPSKETRQNWSKIRKGRPGRDNNSGKHWYNDGEKSYLCFECPDGCVKGRI